MLIVWLDGKHFERKTNFHEKKKHFLREIIVMFVLFESLPHCVKR